MSAPIPPSLSPSPLATERVAELVSEPSPSSSSSSSSFREFLTRAASEVADADRGMSRALQRVGRGADLDTHQLIALQAGVYRHAHRLELTSKLVDQCSGAVKRTLESQR